MTLLRLENLSVERGGIALLDGLSLTIEAGDLLIVKGPNGVGKSTLLRTVAGLQEARSGTIHMDPDSLVYAGHMDAVKTALTVEENLSFWAKLMGGGDVEAALERFELTDLKERLAGRLSAGQKRRLGLARLLVSDRPLWLLDEPTVSLDRHTVALFAQILKAHLDAGGAAMIATHIDLGLAGQELDLGGYIAKASFDDGFEGAFL